MKFTISEIHFIIRNVVARIEWIKNNPDDFSEEEGEKNNLISVLNKLSKLEIDVEIS